MRARHLLPLLIIALIAVGIVPVAHATPTAAVETFTLQFGDFTSKAQLEYPANQPGPFPTVVMIHGGCPCDLNETFPNPDGSTQSTIFKDIAEHLVGQGIAVLRYNKRYVTSSTEVDFAKFSQVKLADTQADAQLVLDAARHNARVDTGRIFLYGWSEGSQIASAIAAKDKALAGLILQGASTRSDRESMIEDYTLVRLPYALSFAPDGKLTSDTLAKAQATTNGWMVGDFVDASVTDHVAVNPFFDTNKDGALDPEAEVKPQLGAFIDTQRAPGGPLADFAAYPTVTQLAPQLALPVLALQGENDALSRFADTALLGPAFVGNRDYILKHYAGLGHSLGKAASLLDDLFRPIAAQPLADLSAWVAAHAGVAPTALPRTGGDTAWGPLVLLALAVLGFGAALARRATLRRT